MPTQGLTGLAQFLKQITGRGGQKATGTAKPPAPGTNQTDTPPISQPQPVKQGPMTGKGVAPGQPAPQNTTPTGPTSVQTAGQQAATTQAGQEAAAGFDPTKAEGAVRDLLSGMDKPGVFQQGLRRTQGSFQDEASKLMEGGLTADELSTLTSSLEGMQTKKHEKGAQQFQSATLEALKGLAPSVAGGAPGAPGQENPFQAQQVRETYGPQVENIYEQGITEADQQLASDQAVRAETGELYGDIQETQDRAGERIEGLQDQAEGQHAAFTEERKGLSEQVLGIPDKVGEKFDGAIDQAMAQVDSAQAIVDTKESAALAGVMQGKSAAMQAAVQGAQGQINSQISQIQGNPNLTQAQKQSMISQVKMQGYSQIAPAVGSTILQFNDLAARTATAFGQMTTQIQGAGVQAVTELAGAGAQAYASTSVAANQLATGLLNTQQNADSNFITNQANLESTRATIEMSGDQLRAQLLPGMGTPYANYHDVMVENLQMDFDLAKTEFQGIMGQYGLELQGWMAAQQARGGTGMMLAQIGQAFGGPLGQGLAAAGGAITAFGGGGQAPTPPGMPGGAGGFGLDKPTLF